MPSTPERVEVMKRMFDMSAQGYGFHSIAQAFNDEGIPSPNGQKWNTARIGKLLRNPVYRGAIAWNRHTMGSLFGLDGEGTLRPKRGKGWKRNDERDWIISEGVHEPLVSREVFDAAQRAIAKRREQHGKARPTKRTLLSGLLTCKRCGHGFTVIRDRRWPGPTGEGYRTYTCTGYHRYGKSVCGVTNVPGPALDTFVLQAVQRLLLGEHKTPREAVEDFVATAMAPEPEPSRSASDDRQLALLNRKIKATVAMLTDPSFDGLDELRTTLAELKAKRDAIEARRSQAAEPVMPVMSETELRTWATEQFARLDAMATGNDIDLKDRQLIKAFVRRIEIEPETKTGVVYVAPDLKDALDYISTRLSIGDFMGAFEIAFYGWKEGAGHHFYGPNNATDLWHVKKVNPQSMVHLTEKPVELAVRAIQYSSKPSENVLDLFGGSGSTLIGCEQSGRQAFLMEIDPAYCDVIVQRWEKFSGKKAERITPDTATEKTPAGAGVGEAVAG